MLDLITLSLFAWLDIWGKSENTLQPLEPFLWHETAIFELPLVDQDLVAEKTIQVYEENLSQQGINNNQQGIWLQSGWNTLSNNQGKTLLPAASLTKIATTLAALNMWVTNHQFATKIYTIGKIENGILQGDLIVEGNGDPLFVWEEAIALGNSLNQLNIKAVQGNLLVTDKFYMNYKSSPKSSGKLLKQSFNLNLWQSEITRQYLQMPADTPQPQIAIAGAIQSIKNIPDDAKLLVTHQSLPLSEILRQMNIYSNNQMAHILTDLLGGAEEIAKSSANIANFPLDEIELINGSGLGEENRISPHAVCQMLIAIDRLLENQSLTTADLFPTAGKDVLGTIQNRNLPPGTTIKTGTLDHVSALAGVVPTKHQGNIYFSIINYGQQYQYFRQQQDWFLNELVQKWEPSPNNINRTSDRDWFFGDPQRNIIIR